MSTKTPESIIIRAIHEAFIKYPEGDGGPNLDYQWVQPEQSAHVAKPSTKRLSNTPRAMAVQIWTTSGFSLNRARTSPRPYFWNWQPTASKL